MERNIYKIGKELFITSDEEIKDGDWWLNLKTNDIDKCTHKSEVLLYNSEKYKHIKKIILTTDQDLIKDGVQAIDDEFLECFVKNPSCERVKVGEIYPSNCCINKEGKTKMNNDCMERNRCLHYKIIIPKEEPKKIFDLPIATNLGNALTETMKSVSQHEGGIKHGEINLPNFKEEVCTCTDECLGYLTKSCKRIEEPKQETLEEAASRCAIQENRSSLYELDMKYFKLGAKWQKEQDNNKYSDEDVIELLKTFDEKFNSGIVERNKGINNWFEQFKKK